jgi:hypothetical protein
LRLASQFAFGADMPSLWILGKVVGAMIAFGILGTFIARTVLTVAPRCPLNTSYRACLSKIRYACYFRTF